MSKVSPPNPKFIGARHHGGSQTPKAIVLHGTVSPDTPGTAVDIANWWHGPTSPVTSAHYIVDPNTVIQCVGDHTVAYHCGYNQNSIGIEMCDEEVGPATRWRDKNSEAILHRTAALVARLCLAYGISASHVTVAGLRIRGPHGIYSHNQSRLAFGYTTHTDPREFPWKYFMGLVKAEVSKLKGGTPKPVVRPPDKPKRPRPTVDVNSFGLGRRSNDIKQVKLALQKKGLLKPGKSGKFNNVWGYSTREAYSKWQKSLGYKGHDANGIPGRTSLQKLGFRVIEKVRPVVDLNSFGPGQRNLDVLKVKDMLERNGFATALHGRFNKKWGSRTRRQYAAWQRNLGYSGKDADGIPGRTSLNKLGFNVTDKKKHDSPNQNKGALNLAISSNIKNFPDMSVAHVDHDVAAVSRLKPTFVGWQEIQDESDQNSIRKHFPAKEYMFLFPHLEECMSIDRHVCKLIAQGYKKAHNGKKKVSPNRYFAWAVVKINNKNVVFMNTHMVSGAWNKKKKRAKLWRKRMWNRHYRMMKKQIAAFNKQGMDVILTGDFNRVKVAKFSSTQTNLQIHGIDKIILIPAKGGAKVHRVRGGIYNGHIYTDHKPVLAYFKVA